MVKSSEGVNRAHSAQIEIVIVPQACGMVVLNSIGPSWQTMQGMAGIVNQVIFCMSSSFGLLGSSLIFATKCFPGFACNTIKVGADVFDNLKIVIVATVNPHLRFRFITRGPLRGYGDNACANIAFQIKYL